VPFLQTTNGISFDYLLSPDIFSLQEITKRKLKLGVCDLGMQIGIYLQRYNKDFVEPALLKMSILDKRGEKVLQKISPTVPEYNLKVISFFEYSKDKIIESSCQQSDGSLIFNCKIFTHLKKEPTIADVLDYLLISKNYSTTCSFQ
jgi:hypothetical protein